MKLLQPKETRGQKAFLEAVNARRTVEMEKATAEVRKRMADAERDFNVMMEGQRKQWEDERKEHVERLRNDGEKEVLELEERRKRALTPIEVLEKRARDTLKEAQFSLSEAVHREKRAEELGELLQDKLDDLSTREQNVAEQEKAMSSMEENIRHRERVSAETAESIRKSAEVFLADKKKQQDAMRDESEKLDERNKELDGREIQLKAQERRLQKQAARLQDERGTLERMIIRMKEGRM